MTVFVETAARLHFGVLDLRGSLGRWFGGIGAAAPGPTLRLSAEASAALEVSGEHAERVAEFASRFQSFHASAIMFVGSVAAGMPPVSQYGLLIAGPNVTKPFR